MSLARKNTTANENGIAINDPEMREIADRFANRGLVNTVKRDEKTQIEREAQTRAEEPEAYRLSECSEEYINARYRRGKDLMSGEDVLQYFREGRERRIRDADFSAEPPSDDLVRSGDAEKPYKPVLRAEERTTVRQRLAMLPQMTRELPARTLERVKESYPVWFDGSRADTSRETRTFPLSAFAAILAVAMSLMLVVASSVMIYHGETRLNSLKIEVSSITGEIREMKSDLSSNTDLLAIRDIAVNEYGMVSEDFVRQEYVSGNGEDSIVVYDNEESQSIGLSALLNALGFK